MNKINENFAKLQGSYLFAEIARRVAVYKQANPGADVISMGIGDVSQPLCPSVTQALHLAVDEMGQASTFHGYGPERGYDFLRQAIVSHEFAPRQVDINPDEVFVSDGAKCDVANFQELFAADAKVALTDPVYPVYIDSNVMAGRAGDWNGQRWSNLIYLPCVAENGFVPQLPAQRPDLIYLCYPNNPTGTVLTREQLQVWVDYARANDSVILFDAAYESFITDPAIPHSIYELEGAQEVAVEFRSYSKKAGFTGLRCAFVVVPEALQVKSLGGTFSLRDMWLRRQGSKYNGCPYIVQKAAEAVYSPEAERELALIRGVYQQNAALIRESLLNLGLDCVGGDNSPYVWARTPDKLPSWDFFDLVLHKAQVVCTPGVGFGPSGEGYARFTAFAAPDKTRQAMERLQGLL